MRIILTDLGEQLASEGFLTGVFPKITKVKFGDGNGNTVVPDKAMTTLVNFVQDGLGTTIARFNNPNRLYIYTMIPVTIGGFTVREIGLFTEADELIAIGGEFEKVKPPVGESTENFDFYITLPISSTQEITVDFSNDNIYASQAALDVLANNAEALRLEMDQTKVIASESVPAGTIFTISTSAIPSGYIECNGALISRTVYSVLFATIGTTFGAGDGSTTFAIPDLRGMFIRGLDNGRGIDVSRVLGSYQVDDFKSHTHLTNANSTSGDAQGNLPLMRSSNAKTNATTATGGTETRPKNIAMKFCIKY